MQKKPTFTVDDFCYLFPYPTKSREKGACISALDSTKHLWNQNKKWSIGDSTFQLKMKLLKNEMFIGGAVKPKKPFNKKQKKIIYNLINLNMFQSASGNFFQIIYFSVLIFFKTFDQ